MERNTKSIVHQINYLNAQLESLYHRFSQALGISDSVSLVLYAIYDTGRDGCPLRDICRKSGLSKQTVNSALRKLESGGILVLTQSGGRTKNVMLTDRGRVYVAQTVARMYQAEADAFRSWTADEVHTYIRLMEKYIACFREEVEKNNSKTIPKEDRK